MSNSGNKVSFAPSGQAKNEQIFSTIHKLTGTQLCQLTSQAQRKMFLIKVGQGFPYGKVG